MIFQKKKKKQAHASKTISLSMHSARRFNSTRTHDVSNLCSADAMGYSLRVVEAAIGSVGRWRLDPRAVRLPFHLISISRHPVDDGSHKTSRQNEPALHPLKRDLLHLSPISVIMVSHRNGVKQSLDQVYSAIYPFAAWFIGQYRPILNVSSFPCPNGGGRTGLVIVSTRERQTGSDRRFRISPVKDVVSQQVNLVLYRNS